MELILLLWLISLFAIYLVIGAAINGSNLAYDVREIRRILESSNKAHDLADANKDNEEGIEYNEYTNCPACGAHLTKNDTECPECGLSLK